MAGILGNIFPNGFMPAVKNNRQSLLASGLGLLAGQTGPQQAQLGAQGFAYGQNARKELQQQNKTLQFLQQQYPELAGYVQAGMPAADALKMAYEQKLKAQMPEKPTSAIQEYNLAKQQGYQGTFRDYQIDLKKSGATNVTVGGNAMPGLGKLSTDYTYQTDAQGNPIIDPNTHLPIAAPVPGSPAAIEAEQAARANQNKTVNRASDAITLQSNITKLKDLMDTAETPVFGTFSQPYAKFSSTPAGKARSLLEPITSGVALDAMMRLKEASKQGATGFGAMNEKELAILVNKMGALNPDTTDPSIIKDTLDNIQRVIDQVKATVPPEMIAKYGLEPLISMDSGGAGGSAPVVIDGYTIQAQ